MAVQTISHSPALHVAVKTVFDQKKAKSTSALTGKKVTKKHLATSKVVLAADLRAKKAAMTTLTSSNKTETQKDVNAFIEYVMNLLNQLEVVLVKSQSKNLQNQQKIADMNVQISNIVTKSRLKDIQEQIHKLNEVHHRSFFQKLWDGIKKAFTVVISALLEPLLLINQAITFVLDKTGAMALIKKLPLGVKIGACIVAAALTAGAGAAACGAAEAATAGGSEIAASTVTAASESIEMTAIGVSEDVEMVQVGSEAAGAAGNAGAAGAGDAGAAGAGNAGAGNAGAAGAGNAGAAGAGDAGAAGAGDVGVAEEADGASAAVRAAAWRGARFSFSTMLVQMMIQTGAMQDISKKIFHDPKLAAIMGAVFAVVLSAIAILLAGPGSGKGLLSQLSKGGDGILLSRLVKGATMAQMGMLAATSVQNVLTGMEYLELSRLTRKVAEDQRFATMAKILTSLMTTMQKMVTTNMQAEAKEYNADMKNFMSIAQPWAATARAIQASAA